MKTRGQGPGRRPSHRTELRCVARMAKVGLMLTVAFPFSGCCTLIGLGVGSAADNARPHGTIAPEKWTSLRPGTEIVVMRDDAAPLRGTYEGSSNPSADGAVLWIRSDSTVVNMKASEISSITAEGSGSNAATGALIGLGLDCLTIVAMSQAGASGTIHMPGW